MYQNISWGKIGVLVVAIVGIGALGFVVGREKSEIPMVSVAPIPPVAQPTKKEGVSEKNNHPISANTTYSNEAIGYSFQYPSEWIRFVNPAYSSDDIKRVIQSGYGSIPEVRVGTLPIDYSLSLTGFDGLKMPSGPVFELDVFVNMEEWDSIDSLINAWMPVKERPVVYVKTDMIVAGAPVYEFNCVGRCFVNDPAVVYVQEYVVVPKPGFKYHITTMVSMNEKEIKDEQKKSMLIEKSKQDFRNIIQSFELKK